MTAPKIIKGELRAYIKWQGRWRHVYILSSQDQTTIMGEVVRVLNFKLSKKSKDTFQAEKSKFEKKKPATRSQKRSIAA